MIKFVATMAFLRQAFMIGLLAFSAGKCMASASDSSRFLRVGFWNLENLFDTRNDAYNDDDFTPEGANFWDESRYQSKLKNLARVIDSLDADLLGVCEVENKQVLKDLATVLASGGLKYDIVHYDSPDERGIDVGLFYNPAVLRILGSRPVNVELEAGDRTRDILYATALHLPTGDTLHYFVNHWPSRRGGAEKSVPARAKAAATLRDFIGSNGLSDKHVLIVGDLNDNPWDSSVREVLGACKPARNATCSLYSLAAFFNASETGTLRHGRGWDLFDQIIISASLWNRPLPQNQLKFKPYSNRIYNPAWMLQQEGKYQGYPLRTFGGKTWLNGYSDHLPVTADFVYE